MSSADEKTGQTVATLQEQASTMKGQLDAMRDEFNATNRPWISIDSTEVLSPLFFGENGNINLSVHFIVVNSGRTPAIFVYPYITPILMTSDGQLYKVIDKARERCADESRREFSPTEPGILVPPGKTIRHDVGRGIIITHDEIQAGKAVVRGREAIVPYIGGCINYEFTFGVRKRHQTGFIYQLLGPDTFIFLDGGNIPIDKLILVEQDGAWAD